MTISLETIRKKEKKLKKVICSSPVALYYQQQEDRWDFFIEKYVPDAELLGWGKEHRVFRSGNRVIKVQSKNFQETTDDNYRIKHEFSLLKKMEGSINKLNPEYRITNDGWHILEMDWIDTNPLEYFINNGQCNMVSIKSLLRSLFHISLLGIEYRQFRARHIYPKINGSFVFIDFGGSKLTNPIISLFRTFTPFTWSNNRLEWSRLFGLVKMILSSRYSDKNVYDNNIIPENLSLNNSLFLWKRNSNRNPYYHPDNLNVKLNDKTAAEHLVLVEHYLNKAINIDQVICEDIFQFQIASYLLYGSKNWGYLWDTLKRTISFTEKKVIDLGSCIGLVGVFSRFSGAKEVISFETLPELIKASENFSKAFKINENKYQLISWDNLKNKKQKLPTGDIIFSLSKRFDIVPHKRQVEILTNYREIIWRTANPNKVKQSLIKKGYSIVRTITLFKERPVVYAKK